MSRSILFAGGVLAWMACNMALAAPPAPILEFRFNDTGTTSASTGTDTSPVTLMRGTGDPGTGTPTDLHGAPGSGLSGLPSDRAFVATDAPGMGKWLAGPVNDIAQSANLASVAGLRSFTITGWFNAEGIPQGDARLVDIPGANLRAQDSAGGTGRLLLQVGTDGPVSARVYDVVGSWLFFAVSYDGSPGATSNLRHYVGSIDSPVSQAGAALTFNNGPTSSLAAPVAIGNSTDGFMRPWDSIIDDIRVFGSADSASGALALGDLELVRQADLQNQSLVPEPASMALLALGVMALLGRRRGGR